MKQADFINNSISYDTFTAGKYIRLGEVLEYDTISNKAKVRIKQTNQILPDVPVSKSLVTSISRGDKCIIISIDSRLTDQNFVIAVFGALIT